MIALFVRLGREQTGRVLFDKTEIGIGSHQHNDLVLRDGRVAEFHCRLEISEEKTWRVTGLAALDVEGQLLPTHVSTPVRDGAKLRLGEYAIVLALNEPALSRDPTEARLLADILAGDHASREVYADWLDGLGREERAELVRLQETLVAGGEVGERARLRICELASEHDIDFAWRRRVGRPPIENCSRPECPGDWGQLAPTDRPDTRTCNECGERVRYCRSGLDGRRVGGKVALDFLAEPAPPWPWR